MQMAGAGHQRIADPDKPPDELLVGKSRSQDASAHRHRLTQNPQY